MQTQFRLCLTVGRKQRAALGGGQHTGWINAVVGLPGSHGSAGAGAKIAVYGGGIVAKPFQGGLQRFAVLAGQGGFGLPCLRLGFFDDNAGFRRDCGLRIRDIGCLDQRLCGNGCIWSYRHVLRTNGPELLPKIAAVGNVAVLWHQIFAPEFGQFCSPCNNLVRPDCDGIPARRQLKPGYIGKGRRISAGAVLGLIQRGQSFDLHPDLILRLCRLGKGQ